MRSDVSELTYTYLHPGNGSYSKRWQCITGIDCAAWPGLATVLLKPDSAIAHLADERAPCLLQRERMLLYGMLLSCNAARAVEGIILCAQFALYRKKTESLANQCTS